jgi:hypothetical protein
MKNFTDYLKSSNILFEIVDNKIIINGGYVALRSLETLPDNVQFKSQYRTR